MHKKHNHKTYIIFRLFLVLFLDFAVVNKCRPFLKLLLRCLFRSCLPSLSLPSELTRNELANEALVAGHETNTCFVCLFVIILHSAAGGHGISHTHFLLTSSVT